MNNLNQSPAQPPGNQPPLFKWTSLLWLVLTLLLLFWLLPSLLGQSGSQTNETVTYSTFLAQVNANNVQSVTISDYTVTGVFKSPVPSSDGTTKSTQFTTTVPQFGNSDVIALLQQHHVAIDVQASSNGGASFWLNILLFVGPVLLMIVFFWWMSRRVTNAQSGIFSFGKS
jgi:cell division protease FtsH